MTTEKTTPVHKPVSKIAAASGTTTVPHAYRKPKPLEAKNVFYGKVSRNVLLSTAFLTVDIGIGIWGYMHFGDMTFAESFANATMVLSGVGATEGLKTAGGQYFEGCYSLICSFVFYTVVAVILTPILHRFLHKFHVDTYGNAD